VKLGLIARADMSGLAVQTYEFYAHMHPDKVMVIDVSQFYDEGENCNKRTDLGRYPNADIIVKGWEPSIDQFENFLEGLDAVYTAETPYGWDLVRLAKQRGIRTYIAINPEFCQHLVIPTLIKPTLLMNPTSWMHDRLPEPKQIVAFPVAPERFPRKSRHPLAFDKQIPAKNFLHVIGRPAAYDRNGTLELLRALQYVKNPINLKLSCLQAGYVIDAIRPVEIPDHVKIEIDEMQPHDYWDIYADQDVLIMPRRWGGMSLPIQEAMASGMPVIMSSSDVYSKQVSDDWVVQSHYTARFQARTSIDVFGVDVRELAECIDWFASDKEAMLDGYSYACQWSDLHSWQALKPLYEDVFAG
jgi:glycosyltransferase involved in cell wall biosynthesis